MLKEDTFYITWQKIRLIYFDTVALYCFKLCFSGATRHGDSRNASQIRQPYVNKFMICFLALLPRSLLLVRCHQDANVAIFCGRFNIFFKGFLLLLPLLYHWIIFSFYYSPIRWCYSKTKQSHFGSELLREMAEMQTIHVL